MTLSRGGVRDGREDLAGVQGPGTRRDRGQLEAEVLAVLGAASGPMTPAEVLSSIGGESAYTTVMTTLSRLHRKGALTRERSGKAFAYSMAGPPRDVADAVTARRMRRLLDSGEDRAGVLARFVAELNPGDEHILAQILDQARATPEPEPGG